MNPNSISHRLFVAALTPVPPTPSKRSARSPGRIASKDAESKGMAAGAAASRKLSDWSWSGWQHNVI